jgi:hypothetical protein
MDLRQAAVNTPKCQLDRVSKRRRPERRQRRSRPWWANVHAARDAKRARTNCLQSCSAPTAPQVWSTAEPNHIEVARRPARRPRRGRVALCTDFLLAHAASRAAIQIQIGSRNMTSASSSKSAELGCGVSALEPSEPTLTTEHPLILLYLGEAARLVPPTARPLRNASAVAC